MTELIAEPFSIKFNCIIVTWTKSKRNLEEIAERRTTAMSSAILDLRKVLLTGADIAGARSLLE